MGSFFWSSLFQSSYNLPALPHYKGHSRTIQDILGYGIEFPSAEPEPAFEFMERDRLLL